MSFVWNGVSSDTMKFNLTSRQVYNAPAYDLNAIEVPGRSGDLLNPQNRFKNKQITYAGFLKASDFEGSTWREKLSTGLIQLKGWLCSDAGNYHELTDDYDPGFTRYGYISGETAISDIENRPFGVTLTVTFNCKPFMYKAGEPMELPETKSASGSIITITDGAENTPLKSAVVNIEPVQDLHGYDNPWPAGGGKNKLQVTDATQTINGVTFTVNADGSIIANGTASPNAAVFFLNRSFEITGSGSYIFSGISGGSGSTYRMECYWRDDANVNKGNLFITDAEQTISVSDKSGATKITTFIISVQNGVTVNNVVFKPMIRLATETDATFAPYENICPISGWTQVKVTRAGVNLLPLRSGSTTQNGQTITPSNGTLVIDGTATTNSALYLKDSTIEGNKIYLPAGMYEVSGFEDYNDANTYVGVNVNSTSGAYTATSKSGNHTFTVEAGDYVFPRARIANGAVMNNYVLKPMIRRVSDASAFSPYQGTERTISLGRTVYGGTLDVVAGEGESMMEFADGTLANRTWTMETISGNNVFSCNAISTKALNYNFISNMYKNAKTYRSNLQNGEMGCYNNTNARNRISICDNRFSTVDEFKAGIANLQLCFESTSPTTLSITPQTIKTLLGVNNIWADAGAMSIEYPIPTENPYPFGSRPLYEITMDGTGTLEVNGKEWTITDYTGTLYCDTEAMEWYDASQLRNNIASGDGWPVFEAGENSVSYTGDITKVMVTPRWRTL